MGLNYRKDGHIARVGLNRPKEKNALIAGNGPRAVQGIIRCFREGREMTYTEAFRKEAEIGLPIFSSADAREGILARQEKRKPNLPGTYA
ncbi:MAG: hypothetical protein ACYDAA_08300 [Syntrophales bacterium]